MCLLVYRARPCGGHHGRVSGRSQAWQRVDGEDSGRGPQVRSPLQGLRTLVCPATKTEPVPQDLIQQQEGRGPGRGPSRKALPPPPPISLRR